MKAKIRKAVVIPLKEGRAVFHSFAGLIDDKEHFAVGFGGWKNRSIPLVRIHSECITGDLFKSCKCDCGDQLNESIHLLRKEGGILLYLRQEGRGIGFYNKLETYALQQKGLDTFEANLKLHFPEDMRNYFVAVQMLEALRVSRIRLLTNNPDKVRQLHQNGITIAQVIPTGLHLKPDNKHYLLTKAVKALHTFQFDFREEGDDSTQLTHQRDCGL